LEVPPKVRMTMATENPLKETLRHSRKALSNQAPTVWLVRHGETNWNSGQTSPERFRSVSDVPLNETGRNEAKKDAARLCKLGADRLYSSDLDRAKESAEIIGKACGLKPELDKRLRPWDLGKLVGTRVKDGIETLNNYSAKRPNTPLPGGESFNAWKEKFLTALDEILKQTEHDKGMTIVVGHTRDLQLTKASAAGGKGLADHLIDIKVFQDYSDETHTGGEIKLVFQKGKWEIVGDVVAPK
jgi:broad specificity phosphatase PhoE